MKNKYYISIFAIVFSLFSFQSIFSQVFWEERNSGVSVSLNSISNIDAAKAWICGDSGTVLMTINNGYNWINVSGNGIPNNITLVNIFGINSTNAITAGFKDSITYVYRTTNSGLNWIQVFSQTSGFINAVWMKTDTVGFMEGNPVGGRWSLWKTTDKGANWDSTGLFLPQLGNEKSWRNSLYLVGNKLWFGTNNSRIYYSDSSGYHWIALSTAPDSNSFSIFMDIAPSLVGYSAGSSISRTTNGGLNWSIITGIGSGYFNCISGKFQSLNYVWLLRSSSNIYMVYGGGGNWFSQYTAPSGIYNCIAISRTLLFWGPGLVYAIRNNGGISRGNAFIDAVILKSNEIPKTYSIEQNYPNPFNISTKIQFSSKLLPHSSAGEVRGGNVRLTVYNMLGQEVSILVNKIIQPGTYEIGWDGKNSPSGIYFYRYTITDPNRANVVYDKFMKMVMIK
jgi:photosystem II stability/assembly factor-like uncharacterized protein